MFPIPLRWANGCLGSCAAVIYVWGQLAGFLSTCGFADLGKSSDEGEYTAEIPISDLFFSEDKSVTSNCYHDREKERRYADQPEDFVPAVGALL